MPCGLLGESRFEEHFASDMHQVVDEIACALLPIIQGENFTFFGHRYLTSVLIFFFIVVVVVFKPLF